MPAGKRRAPSPPPSRKRSKQGDSPAHDVIEILDDEESMESIMARIQEQESSEAFAKQLDERINGSAGPSQPPGFNEESQLNNHDNNIIAFDGEDDEAMARRLAEEWEQEDAVPMDVDDALLAPESSAQGKAKELLSVAYSRTASSGTSGAHSSAEEDLMQHRNLFVLTRKCSKCGQDVVSPRGYVTYTPQTPPPSLLALLHATCPSCKTNHCRGCFSAVDCLPSCKGNQKSGSSVAVPCAATTCCAEVRAIALFEALGGFDRVYISEQATAEKRAQEASAKRRSAMGSVGPGGTGYGTSSGLGGHWGSLDKLDLDVDSEDEFLDAMGEHPYVFGPRGKGRGRGRGRGRELPVAGSQAHTSTQATMAAHWDEILSRALTTITSFLPAPYADDAQNYDILPHSCMPSLIVMSKLPELLGALLRNDSIMEWTARSDVYTATLGLLRRFADCELTMQVLIGQRWEIKKTCGLEEWMWEDGEITWENATDTNRPVFATPLYRYFKKLTKQCETFLAGAAQMLEGDTAQDAGEETEKIVQATSLCGDMLAARDDIERAMVVMGKDPEVVANGAPEPPLEAEAEGSSSVSLRKTRGKGKGKSTDVGIERIYRQRCEQLAFQYVDIPNNALTGHFFYASQVTSTANATRSPKDRIHLIKELAVMATSLPPGIWVRIDETRNDIIKVMIAGPEGTPYSDGLFEFDCFIPLEYPNIPPLMNLCTTGGGRVRFNPNLYNNGKVCLSLLGTWEGSPEEMWRPRKSTLLQVFVSIQSMILIDLPYFNEPGYGKANAADVRSKSYNKNISLQTTRWAIVEWLKDEYKDGIWSDVIASHFTIREEKVRQCIQTWSRTNPAFRVYLLAPHAPGHVSPFTGASYLPSSSLSSQSADSKLSPQPPFGPSTSALSSLSPSTSLPTTSSTSAAPAASKTTKAKTSKSHVSALYRTRKGGKPGPGWTEGVRAKDGWKPSMDLVVAFEEGMKVVKGWGKDAE